MTLSPPARAAHIAVVALAALAIRLWLIFTFPIVFGYDSMARLVNSGRILLSYQLPLLQLLIWAAAGITRDPLLVRIGMAAIGAAAGVAFYQFAAGFVDRRAALCGGVLFATNPFVTAVSTVPYQEILMVALLLFAFHFFFGERWMAASLCLGLACLTRFEAWAACPVFLAAYAYRERFKPRLARGAVLFGWAPAAWMVFRGGLAPSGSFVLDRAISWRRLFRLPYLGWHTLINTPVPALLLACAGIAVLIEQRGWRDRRLQMAGAFLLLFAIAILFSWHGEPPDTERFVTTREIHIPVLMVTLLAAFGCARFPRAAVPLVVLAVALGFRGARRFVEHETSRPEIRLGYVVASYLDRNVQPGERVLLLAKPIVTDFYFRRLRETGGEAALREGQKRLTEIDMSPLDYQRTLIHSRMGRDRLWAFPRQPASVQWLVVWSDFAPPDAQSAEWARLAMDHPAARLQVGERSAAVYRLR